jgi:protein-disulfide isomerase
MSLRTPVSDKDHILGNADAPLTLVEYGDYQCPHCAAADLVVQALLPAFGENLRVVFRNFPLTQIHPVAEMTAEFAESAGSQRKFWPAHDAIFAWAREYGSENLGPETFGSIAGQLKLDADKLAADMREQRYLQRIKDDFNSGVRSGVNGTPTFFINGQRFDGAPSVGGLTAALHAARASAAQPLHK